VRLSRSEELSRDSSARQPGASSERKTGLKHAEVITARVVQDERGWLRLAG